LRGKRWGRNQRLQAKGHERKLQQIPQKTRSRYTHHQATKALH